MARRTRRHDPAREDAGGRVVLALVLGLALLTGLGYVGAYVAAGNRIPVGTEVAGVDIGGHKPASAEEALRAGLSGRATTPFTVTANGHTQQVRPGRVGLAVDYAASVRAAGATRSWRPSKLWDYYTSGSTLQPVVRLDQAKLGRLLRRLDAADGRTARDGAVVFRRHRFVVRQPRTGLSLDPRAAGSAFWGAYLSDDPSVQLPMSSTEPRIDSRAIQHFVRAFANPAVSSSVTLHLGRAVVRLQPGDYAGLLGARRVGHELRPTVRAGAVAAVARQDVGGRGPDRPRDATVALVRGRPHVVRARAGLRFAAADIGSALLRAIRSPQRTARVHSTVATASFSTADARRLGVRQSVASFTVHLPRGHAHALLAAAHRIDQTVLRPGATFSLRGRLGSVTPEGSSGSALATALFNAAWLGGLQVTAHTAATTYDGTAPVGRDASLRDGQDLAFANRTPYGVLVSVDAARPTTTHGGSLTVSLWSTRRWSVTSTSSARTRLEHPRSVVRHGRHCRSRKGRDGFSVTVTRSMTPAGTNAEARTSSYTVRYAPVAGIDCRR